MPKCKNAQLLNMITQDKLTDNTVITFNILDRLPDCKKILANAYTDITSGAGFNAYKRPKDRFDCDALCTTSGTQYVEANGSVTYKAQYDATEFANGVITFYVAASGAGSVSVSISTASNFTNADVYTKAYTEAEITDDGFVPVVIDLTATPTSVEGTGWDASASGAFIRITSTTAAGISTISIYDDMNDFAVNDVVQMACLTGFEGTDDMDVLENDCIGGGYDTTTDSAIERTVTGRMLTANYMKLNPRSGKGDKVDGYVQTTIAAKVESYQDGAYGVVTLYDKADDCGWLKAEVNDPCLVTDSELELLSIPTLVAMDSDHFVAVDGTDSTNLYFNKDLIGMEVLITYPKAVAVENHLTFSMDNVMTGRRVRMTIENPTSDGKKHVFVAHNVLITSFPMGLTNEDAEFAITFAIQRDANGVNYERYTIAS